MVAPQMTTMNTSARIAPRDRPLLDANREKPVPRTPDDTAALPAAENGRRGVRGVATLSALGQETFEPDRENFEPCITPPDYLFLYTVN